MPRKILLIDDDLDILETMGALIEHENFEVVRANTVEDGMDLINEVSPDIILLDVMFPEKKTRGFEAASIIKEKHPDIPVFIVTAINRDYAFDFEKSDVKADEFLNKPVKTDRIIELINEYLH